MSENSGKLKKFIIRNRAVVVFIALVLVIFLAIILFGKKFSTKKTYTVVMGSVEKTTDGLASVIKKESIVDLNKTDVAMPIIEQGKKVAKDETIAVYKNNKYTEYLSQIDEMDKQIQTLVQDLPATYSSDVSQIDNEISKITKEALNITSYVKMQEYKNRIDELSQKKVSVLGALSPAGSKIRELIAKREEIEKTSKEAADNIKSNMGGIVTYKIDKLEDVANIKNINKFTASDFDNIYKSYLQNNTNEFGIKIVDNYLAYLVVKEPIGENNEYMSINSKYYTIRLNDKTGVELSGKILRINKTDEYNYVVFEITNQIEYLIDSRLESVEVVWKKFDGLAVPNDAIKKNEEKGYSYVTLINGSEYIDVPIVIKTSKDNISIVENMTKEQKEELNITSRGILELYDQLVIDTKE